MKRVVSIGVVYAAALAVERAVAGDRLVGANPDIPHLASHLTLYVAATAGAFGLYAGLLFLCARGQLNDRHTQTVALALPVAFSVALLVDVPQWSTDVFTYIVHGHQLTVGVSPYAEPAKAVAGTPFGEEVAKLGWIPVHGVSPYGPLWTSMELAVSRVAGHDLSRQVWLFKGIALASMLASACVIWLILTRVAPERRLLGTLVFLWNPAVMVETAAEGHNESVMLLAILVSILCCLSGRATATVISLVLGGLLKVVPLVYALPQAVFLWLGERNRARLIARTVLGLGMGAAIAVLVFRPVWIGIDTFDGLRAHARPSVLASTPGVLLLYLNQRLPEVVGARLLGVATAAAFALYAVVVSARVWDADSLLRTCGQIAVAYLVLAPGYWPWYVVAPVALLALAPDRHAIVVAMAFSFCSRIAAPIDVIRLDGFMGWRQEVVLMTVIGVWLPAALWVAINAPTTAIYARLRHGRVDTARGSLPQPGDESPDARDSGTRTPHQGPS